MAEYLEYLKALIIIDRNWIKTQLKSKYIKKLPASTQFKNPYNYTLL